MWNGALWFSFLAMVVHFKIKKLVVINSFWNGVFSFYCLHIFLPFLWVFSILNSLWIQLGCTFLVIQTSCTASAAFSAPFSRGKYLLKFWFFVWHWKAISCGHRNLGEEAGAVTEREGRLKNKEKLGALEEKKLEAWHFWDVQLEY